MNYKEKIVRLALKGGWIKSPYEFEFKEILGEESRGYTVGIRFFNITPSDSYYHLEMLLMNEDFWKAVATTQGACCDGDVRRAACHVCGGWSGGPWPWDKQREKFFEFIWGIDDIESALKKILIKTKI